MEVPRKMFERGGAARGDLAFGAAAAGRAVGLLFAETFVGAITVEGMGGDFSNSAFFLRAASFARLAFASSAFVCLRTAGLLRGFLSRRGFSLVVLAGFAFAVLFFAAGLAALLAAGFLAFEAVVLRF